jgi:hypothetical protein
MLSAPLAPAPMTLESEFGGLPFLDDGFAPSRLLSAVAALRRWNCGGEGPLEDYISPEAGLAAARLVGYSETDLGAREPTAGEWERLQRARASIIARQPRWRDLLALPCVVKVIDTDEMFGWSCISMPQHIYLGTVSFASDEDALEQYLHELAHNWLYLIQELWAFEDGDWVKSFVLPSGTPGKSVTGVLDASFVMAVLRRYYRSVDNEDRGRSLGEYVRGCVEMLAERPDLTAMGRRVWARLAQA